MAWQLIEVEGKLVPAKENNESILTIVDEDGVQFAAVLEDEHARLIAAAPDMLADLIEARATFIVEYAKDGSVAAVGYDSNALRPLVLLLDAAIAKAEGRE